MVLDDFILEALWFHKIQNYSTSVLWGAICPRMMSKEGVKAPNLVLLPCSPAHYWECSHGAICFLDCIKWHWSCYCLFHTDTFAAHTLSALTVDVCEIEVGVTPWARCLSASCSQRGSNQHTPGSLFLWLYISVLEPKSLSAHQG